VWGNPVLGGSASSYVVLIGLLIADASTNSVERTSLTYEKSPV
jgi:hypothetical protein